MTLSKIVWFSSIKYITDFSIGELCEIEVSVAFYFGDIRGVTYRFIWWIDFFSWGRRHCHFFKEICNFFFFWRRDITSYFRWLFRWLIVDKILNFFNTQLCNRKILNIMESPLLHNGKKFTHYLFLAPNKYYTIIN